MRSLVALVCSCVLVLALGNAFAAGGRDQTPPSTTASPTTGTYTGAVTVTLTPNEPAKTYYCTGTGCTPASIYSQPLTVRRSTTLRYYSVDRRRNVEATKSQTYTISIAPTTDTTPPVTTASPAGGTFGAPITVALTTNEPATITYCTNGSSCTPVAVYSEPIPLSASTTLRYYALDSTGNQEAVKSQTYTITPPAGGHAGLTWAPNGYQTCLTCHADKAADVFKSVHYQWQGPAAEMANGPTQQGKLAGAVNAYCINILGNFGACSSCHVGLGANISPVQSQAQLENIDCLVCHQKDYRRTKDTATGRFVPDTVNMTITMDQALQTVHTPVRANCLQCHAKAGGGDALKRGDLALATANTADVAYDRHMATTGANLVCQSCHQFTNHRVAGRGSDLRPLDSTASISCSSSTCHSTKTATSGHATAGINKHVTRVACQTCHIPVYAKNASDSAVTEATEIHRNWTVSEWNATLGRYEPTLTKANNLKPVYKFFNGTSWGYSMGEVATLDNATQSYQVSRPMGSVTDASATTKLYPFKYKTADQPKTANLAGGDQLIMLSTKDYFATGKYDTAVQAGLVNMGLSSGTPYTTAKTDEYQLLNHQVAPRANALQCTSCHLAGTAAQMNLQSLGYGLKKATSDLCNDCHSLKSYTRSYNSFTSLHSRHVDSERYDCARCHTFSRPERGLSP
jgi:hypothetical protein